MTPMNSGSLQERNNRSMLRTAPRPRALGMALRCAGLLGVALLCLQAGKGQSPVVSADVKIGYCGTINQIDLAKHAGFDYMELRASEVTALNDADFAHLQSYMKQIQFPVLVMYQFVPSDLKLTGPNVDTDKEMAYVRRALDRASKLGAHIIAMGSGGARSYPAGFPKDQAYAQLVDFCKRLGPEARARNIVIAIEPLRPQESNLINSLAEAQTFINTVGDPNIQLNLDYYQFEQVKEDPADILASGDHIVHIHFANPNGRILPLVWKEYNYAPLFDNLRKIKYDREIGIEANSNDFEHLAPQSIAFVRSALLR
jgi:D-psicose/D-tagatose/L-ribulose 3-epimerase